MQFTFNPNFPNATPEQKWSQFKLYRLAQMQLCDWTQSNDVSLSEQEVNQYREYRSFLKDAPNTFETVEDVQFPGYVAVVDYNIVFIAEPYTVQPI